jgi:hypothetical protein
MSDSLMMEVTGQGKDRLVRAIELCDIDHATGVEQRGNELVIFWSHDSKTGQPLAVKPTAFADGIIEWLGKTKGTNRYYLAPDFGPEPDIDGHCEKGWKLISRDREIRVAPQWMIYHK